MSYYYNKTKILNFILLETNEPITEINNGEYFVKGELLNHGGEVKFNGDNYKIESEIDLSRSHNGWSKLFFRVNVSQKIPF